MFVVTVLLACLFCAKSEAKSAEMKTFSTTGKLSGYSFDGVYRHFQMEGVNHFCGPGSEDRAVIKLSESKSNDDKKLRAAYYAKKTVTITSELSLTDFNECKILWVQVYPGLVSIVLR